MALSEADARDVARGLLDVRAKECRRLDEIRRYVRGEVIRVFRPRRHTRDYTELVDMARTNIIPLVVSTFAENLAVTGFKPAKAPQMSPAWDRDWQANRMDARQSALWRTAIEYGLSYASVLPGRMDGKKLGLISLWSPRQCTAVYDDPIGDEWPVYFITVRKGWDARRRKYVQRVTLTDDELLYHFIRSGDSEGTLVLDEEREGGPVQAHGLEIGPGMAPLVRFAAAGGDLDDQARGEVEPLMPYQDALNQTTFTLRTVERAQGWRQRWAAGIEIQEDEHGNPVEPFAGGADKVWISNSANTKFGEFSEADPSGLLESRQSTMRIITAVAQMAPHSLLVTDGIANLSSDALAALEAAQQRKINEYKTSFGESVEQLLRLTSLAADDMDGWRDRSSQVIWRDTESRSLGQVADALGKLAQMLGIPRRAMWRMAIELLPWLSQQDLEAWEREADREDGVLEQQMERELERMTQQTQLEPEGGAQDGNARRRPARAGAPA